MLKQKGFSLIELLIVVTIILTIAAIAVPNFLRSRISANEASAVGSIHTINTAESIYASTYPATGYATTLGALSGGCSAPSSTNACLIDATLAAATSASNSKSGYYFTLAASSSLGYTLLGTPAKQGVTGIKNFYNDSTNAITYITMAGDATAASPAIQ
jgi:prepilin-type N-terminal cleavage/methylation domain-containing protein